MDIRIETGNGVKFRLLDRKETKEDHIELWVFDLNEKILGIEVGKEDLKEVLKLLRILLDDMQ